MDDVLINKSQTIERCLSRICEIYKKNQKDFKNNFDAQDAIILNLQRACEASIDMAAHVVRLKRLDVPQSSRDFFIFLAKQGMISEGLSQKMQAMVGFRNIAIHNYEELNLDIVVSIIEHRLDDFTEFTQCLLKKM
jgi:uncharacterized protein YutE (UPF0331/DUF86 family)